MIVEHNRAFLILYGCLKIHLIIQNYCFLFYLQFILWRLFADEDFENEEDKVEVKKVIDYLSDAALYYVFTLRFENAV